VFVVEPRGVRHDVIVDEHDQRGACASRARLESERHLNASVACDATARCKAKCDKSNGPANHAARLSGA
jgi:hypothetical protein